MEEGAVPCDLGTGESSIYQRRTRGKEVVPLKKQTLQEGQRFGDRQSWVEKPRYKKVSIFS